ncbi:MAG: flavodoxin family protein [Christensenellales bacterium]
MKTLIINGSPRRRGDSYALLTKIKENLKGDIDEVFAYYDRITPCVDCRRCWQQPGCVFIDDMDRVYADDYDSVIIASPLYMSGLTGPLVSLASRFQCRYAQKRFLKQDLNLRPKTGALIITGGGDGKTGHAISLAKWMFKHMNANLPEENIILSMNTDESPARDDVAALKKAGETAIRLNAANCKAQGNR